MTRSTYDRNEIALPLPLTQTALQLADRFAHRQPSPEKATQVRLNTLAVCVVNDYLQLMGWPTDLSAGDSWNPMMQLCSNVADLDLPGVGRLECRPVLPGTDVCQVPAETWHDRLAYVVVEIDEAAQLAWLLGMALSTETEELPMSQLQAPEDLMDYLASVRPLAVTAVQRVEQAGRAITRLGQWLQGSIEAGWQTVDSLLNPPELSPAFAFRRSPAADAIERGLPLMLGTTPLVLVVSVSPVDDQVRILLQLHPTQGNPTLLPGIEFGVLDEAGTIVISTESAAADNYLQLELFGIMGESFQIELAQGSDRITQAFVI
jgi:hypothetical protein